MWDINEIKEQFKQVVEYSQNICDVQVDELFDEWFDAKRDFIDTFDGELIYEFPEDVVFNWDEEKKSEKYASFVANWVIGSDYKELGKFLLVQKEGFYNNQVVVDYELPDGSITIKKGMKLAKAFKYFVDDVNDLEALQIELSRIIQANKIVGRFCVSVHPLDFLSISENAHNWRSCHALDGDYRGGNLSYMQDSSTIICYLKAKDGDRYMLPNFPEEVRWNSKKWRMLLFFSNDFRMLFAGRQYPFEVAGALSFIKDKMLTSIFNMEISDWTKDCLSQVQMGPVSKTFYTPYYLVGDKLIQKSDLIRNAEKSLQFNDLLSSSCYVPYYAYAKHQEWNWGANFPAAFGAKATTRFIIGGGCKCLKCGIDYIDLTSSFMCDDCELKYGTEDNDDITTCPCCGRRFFTDDGVWLEATDEVICEDCYDTETETCSGCGERFYTVDLWYSEVRDGYYCECCR